MKNEHLPILYRRQANAKENIAQSVMMAAQICHEEQLSKKSCAYLNEITEKHFPNTKKLDDMNIEKTATHAILKYRITQAAKIQQLIELESKYPASKQIYLVGTDPQENHKKIIKNLSQIHGIVAQDIRRIHPRSADKVNADLMQLSKAQEGTDTTEERVNLIRTECTDIAHLLNKIHEIKTAYLWLKCKPENERNYKVVPFIHANASYKQTTVNYLKNTCTKNVKEFDIAIKNLKYGLLF